MPRARRRLERAADRWLLPALVVLFHLATARGYGYFRDELYYLACARHLDFGYVDQPPLVAVIARLVSATLGTSRYALRLKPPAMLTSPVTVISRVNGYSPGRSTSPRIVTLGASISYRLNKRITSKGWSVIG